MPKASYFNFPVLVVAAALAAPGPAAAGSEPLAGASNCGERAQIIRQLEERYGETRRSVALAPNRGVVEVYASAETGTWTILLTLPTGITCLVAAGEAFEPMAGTGAKAGDPA